MSHLYALLVINILFGAALYSGDKTVRRSLFSASGLTAFSYVILILSFGVSWLFAGLVMVFVGIESMRRARHIKSDRSNRDWAEMQLIYILVLLSTQGIQTMSAINRDAILFSLFAVLVVVINLLMRRHIKRHSFKPVETIAEESLPTVSLLIPARNEDHALEDTLNEALNITYPKLEILVLDDCSNDTTPDIIRSFAHKGIRFIEGQPLTDDWLGKNFALEQLRIAANGDVHIYCDVDVQLQPYTVTELVQYMIRSNVKMVSVLPATRDFDIFPLLIRPLYNFMVTLAPFGALGVARTYGKMFAVTKKVVDKYSFEQSKHAVIPEQNLATKLKATKSYHSIIGDIALGASIRKRVSSQLRNQQRTLYPLLGSSTMLASLYATGLLTAVFLPLLILPSPLNLLIYGGYVVAYTQYLFVHAPQSVIFAPFQLVLLVILEAGGCIYSLLTYSFSELSWKDRRVCLVDNKIISIN